MRHLSVVLVGILLLSVAASEAQAKPEKKEQKEKSKAPNKGKAAARVFKIYKPYHLLRESWAMNLSNKYVLVEAAFPSEFEAREKCKGVLYRVPGVLFSNFSPKLWYCIEGSQVSTVPLSDSVLKQHKPLSSLLSKNDAFVRYAGVFRAVDTSSLTISQKGLHFVTALNNKVLLAFSMVQRTGFRRKGKDKDYGLKWPLDPTRYRGRIWTISTTGKTISENSFKTCGIALADLRRLSDRNYVLMLSESYHLPKHRSHFRTRLYVWKPDGRALYSTVLDKVVPWQLPKDEDLPRDRFVVWHEDDLDAACCEWRWDKEKKALIQVAEE